MDKTRRTWFWILLVVLLLHIIGLLLVLGTYYAKRQKPKLSAEQPKIIMVEPTKPKDLPTMLPGQITPKIPPSDEPEDEQENEKDLQEGQPVIKEIKPIDEGLPEKSPTTTPPTPTTKPRRKKKSGPKPVFNFDMLNAYAFAEGNSAFKNQGVNRPPRPEDVAHLLYQEKIRKHFVESFNQFANRTYFYNIDEANLELSFTINQTGHIANTQIKNHSNNLALPKLIKEILAYAAPFPKIPDALKTEQFVMDYFNINIRKGKLDSGYRWH